MNLPVPGQNKTSNLDKKKKWKGEVPTSCTLVKVSLRKVKKKTTDRPEVRQQREENI